MATNQKKLSRFPNTRWSLVGRAAASDELTRQQALAELLVAYTPALRAFLVETRRVPPALAEDLLQDFVCDKVLAQNLVHHADQGRGKFRNLLLKALNNFVTTRLQREYAARALTAGFDASMLAALTAPQSPDRFEQEWVQQVVREALQLMETDCGIRGRTDLWEIFCLRVVEPLLHDTEPLDYAQIIRRFDLRTPREAINLLASAKRRFFTHVRTAVGRYVYDEAQIDEELADLRAIVGR